MRHKPKRRYPKYKKRYFVMQFPGYKVTTDLVRKTLTLEPTTKETGE